MLDFKNVKNDSYEFPHTGSLPMSSSALSGDLEVMAFNH